MCLKKKPDFCTLYKMKMKEMEEESRQGREEVERVVGVRETK